MQYVAIVLLMLALIAAAFGLAKTPAVADAVAWFWCSAFLGMAIMSFWRWRDDHHHHR
jgi:hypothetical protein